MGEISDKKTWMKWASGMDQMLSAASLLGQAFQWLKINPRPRSVEERKEGVAPPTVSTYLQERLYVGMYNEALNLGVLSFVSLFSLPAYIAAGPPMTLHWVGIDRACPWSPKKILYGPLSCWRGIINFRPKLHMLKYSQIGTKFLLQ